MLFLEAPAGVGFSYSNNTQDNTAPGAHETIKGASAQLCCNNICLPVIISLKSPREIQAFLDVIWLPLTFTHAAL